jgi:hypothetical protein
MEAGEANHRCRFIYLTTNFTQKSTDDIVTFFNDAQTNDSGLMKQIIAPTDDSFTETSTPTIMKVLQRPVILGSGLLSTSSAVNTVLSEFSLPTDMFQKSINLRRKLDYNTYI